MSGEFSVEKNVALNAIYDVLDGMGLKIAYADSRRGKIFLESDIPKNKGILDVYPILREQKWITRVDLNGGISEDTMSAILDEIAAQIIRYQKERNEEK